MSCELTTTGRALFVLWGRPAIADVSIILDAANAVVAKTGGPLIVIARVPPDTPPPNAVVQDAIKQRMTDLLAHCSAFHVIMEGTGFMMVVKRSVLGGILLSSGRRKTFFVHASVDALRASMARDASKHAVEAVLVSAERRLMLTRTLPDDPREATVPARLVPSVPAPRMR